ncbi:MAG: N-6 DNA methylase [Microcoleaceae cyanobacterium]
MNTNDIVQKLWNLCNILRDDGITYLQYVTELTYLLFLKMLQETDNEDKLPKGYCWADIETREGNDQLNFYRELLLKLGTDSSPQIKGIFVNAQTALKKPVNLKTLVNSIDTIDWYSAREEGLGDLYEGLLEKNAEEKKSGAGQYFTPRALIDSMVHLLKPQAGEYIQDPAAGTGGFLIASDRYIKQQTGDLYKLSEKEQKFQRQKAFYGIELVQDAHRLLLMNMMLHSIDGKVILGDSLSSDGQNLQKAHLILSNPPFGTKKGGEKTTRDDFTFPTSNKQLAFLQHIYRGLLPEGRAGVVIPDNVLFEDGQGRQIRADLMDKCNLHTILRLPTGIFYAQGVKTNVLFFQRGKTDKNNTKGIWYYDLRTNMPSFGKRIPLTREHFQEFEKCYGKTTRKSLGEDSRWQYFNRKEILERNDNLDISWLRDDNLESGEDLLEPDILAEEIIASLENALAEMTELMDAI